MYCLALQIHGQAAWKLYLKDSPDGEVTVIDKLDEVRAFIDRLMRPAVKPSNIYAHHYEESEVVLWYNRAVWHSVVSLGSKSFRRHLADLQMMID